MFNNHSKKWASVNGMKGYVIAPDGFEGELANSYANDAELVTAGNLVFLPAAGYRRGFDVSLVGGNGYYWSSTAYGNDCAHYLYFDSDGAYPDDGYDSREFIYSVRLVKDASVTPAPTPTPTPTTGKGTAKATIGGSEVDVNWVQLWAGSPKFADRNVGASSATDAGSSMTFTDATKAGADYVWGANWCTPSKDQMDELLKAATSDGSTKVDCNYIQENGVYGFKFTGKETGYTSNSVFFPVQNGNGGNGSEGYWSATAEDDFFAWYLALSYNDEDGWDSSWDYFTHDYEFLVRPVLNN